jgi:hypothetical protein
MDKLANHRFVCVPCKAETAVNNATWTAASVALGALGWKIAEHPKLRFCLCCPKCL